MVSLAVYTGNNNPTKGMKILNVRAGCNLGLSRLICLFYRQRASVFCWLLHSHATSEGMVSRIPSQKQQGWKWSEVNESVLKTIIRLWRKDIGRAVKKQQYVALSWGCCRVGSFLHLYPFPTTSSMAVSLQY